MITYKALNDCTSTAVYLDGKRIGVIRATMGHENRRWTYHPNGGTPGEPFTSLAACKASLEAK